MGHDGLARVKREIEEAARATSVDRFVRSLPEGYETVLDNDGGSISAGERQKCEILKQLYLERRFLILDEPTSVLTPDEADEVLSTLKKLTQAGQLTIVTITHKFREVNAFCDTVTVLRRGQLVGTRPVSELDNDTMAEMMVGRRLDQEFPQRRPLPSPSPSPRLDFPPAPSAPLPRARPPARVNRPAAREAVVQA